MAYSFVYSPQRSLNQLSAFEVAASEGDLETMKKLHPMFGSAVGRRLTTNDREHTVHLLLKSTDSVEALEFLIQVCHVRCGIASLEYAIKYNRPKCLIYLASSLGVKASLSLWSLAHRSGSHFCTVLPFFPSSSFDYSDSYQGHTILSQAILSNSTYLIETMLNQYGEDKILTAIDCEPEVKAQGVTNYMNAPIFASPKSVKGQQLQSFPATPRSEKTMSFGSGRQRFLMFSERLGVVQQTEIDRMDADFEVLGVLGEGHFSIVYKCKSKRDGSLTAIKRFKKRQRGVLDRHTNLREVQRLAEISMGATGLEEFIVGFVDCWEQRNRLHVQTELCERSLEQELTDKGTVSEEITWKLIADVSKGLKLIHSHNLIHLDIKPANIMYGPSTFKLCDFGLCTEEGPISEEGDRTYLAPEVLQGQACFASDVYSLGLVVVRCRREGGLPKEGEDWLTLRRGGWIGTEGISRRLETLVRAMLTEDPWGRPTVDGLISASLPQNSFEGRGSISVPRKSLGRPSVVEVRNEQRQEEHAINLSEVFKHM